MARYKRVCDLCGAEKPEFTVTSKHLGFALEELKEFDSLETDHITRHICTDCFLKIFKKPEGNPTIEQNAGENRIEGGVLSISGSVDTFRCWKCGRTLPISERTDSAYMSNPPKYACKECEGIKKEKQYRPFNNCGELIEYWYDFTGVINCSPKLFMPTIWVKHKRYGTESLITAFDNNNESIGANVIIQDMGFTMQELFDNFTFLDGSPCGKEEK